MALDLCTVKKAEHPYTIASVGVKIRTIEELCFFLSRNLCLIDRSVVCEELAGWVGSELGLKTLSRKLHDALMRPDRDVSYFIMPIFAEIGYLNPDEQRRVRSELYRVSVQPEEESAKMKADYLVMCGKLDAAMTSYRRILRGDGQARMRASFLENVWNNLGCACARAFRFREAADAFLSGYRIGNSKQLLRKYVSVLPMYLGPEEYEKKVKETGADPVLLREIEKMNAGKAEDISERVRVRTRPDEDVKKAAERLFSEYRRCAS